MAEVNVIYGYQLYECMEKISPELLDYAARIKEDVLKVQIYDDVGVVYIGIPMYSKDAPEDQFDWEGINYVEPLVQPEVFYLPYALSKIAETATPQTYVIWDLTY